MGGIKLLPDELYPRTRALLREHKRPWTYRQWREILDAAQAEGWMGQWTHRIFARVQQAYHAGVPEESIEDYLGGSYAVPVLRLEVTLDQPTTDTPEEMS